MGTTLSRRTLAGHMQEHSRWACLGWSLQGSFRCVRIGHILACSRSKERLRAMPLHLVHFFSMLMGEPACGCLAGEEPLVAFVDPARVTCPECLRYLRQGFWTTSGDDSPDHGGVEAGWRSGEEGPWQGAGLPAHPGTHG